MEYFGAGKLDVLKVTRCEEEKDGMFVLLFSCWCCGMLYGWVVGEDGNSYNCYCHWLVAGCGTDDFADAADVSMVMLHCQAGKPTDNEF
eukprot:2874306-Ditylum_brightwellii.AAC.1